MKIIELNSQKTKAAIADFITTSKNRKAMKAGFFEKWAIAKNQDDAIYAAAIIDIVDNQYKKIELTAFDKMLAAIDNEISEYAFKSSEWRY